MILQHKLDASLLLDRTRAGLSSPNGRWNKTDCVKGKEGEERSVLYAGGKGRRRRRAEEGREEEGVGEERDGTVGGGGGGFFDSNVCISAVWTFCLAR